MSDYETTQKKRDVIVGIFVFAALCALVLMIIEFGELPTFVSRLGSFQVFVQFPKAPGVQEDTPVRFCGYQIGKVTGVMAPQIREDKKTGRKYHQTLVVLSINKKYVNIPSDIVVKLMTRGLGSSYIELAVNPESYDPNGTAKEYLAEGNLLQGSTGMTSEFFPEESQKKLDELSNGLKSLVDSANDILGDEANKEKLKTTLANLSDASKHTSQALKEFREFINSGVGTSEELGRTLAEMRLILEKINSGEGTAGRFINDGRLYENLLENTQQMQVLLEELKAFIAKSQDKGIPIKLK